MKHCSLREARKDSGRTVDKIAADLGIHRTQVYRIEAGTCQASPELARKIREYWPKKKVPDLAIYDPKEFERRRAKRSAA